MWSSECQVGTDWQERMENISISLRQGMRRLFQLPVDCVGPGNFDNRRKTAESRKEGEQQASTQVTGQRVIQAQSVLPDVYAEALPDLRQIV
ncbi:hypothetical protein HBI56_079990 [Parastagonospora nodorum]|uniref:Uncharacterized protein n=1 Tax=Phaeosphaeria nodorum (strain SN15 / ATCC MYA-4574 / FGSC 10173) TaxID=321614 RepID=A0A7U2FGI2_PHANO|nr:hypothetical protein HBH56_106730 [Parastagonospora nodorum]QRD04859.1 hypothetical protein JI435_421880 [Parastagonospora nodorum SN15]KAH3929295.1 hypothetical protein HBH54_123690 [Parastagonospora nodorum]KAH3951732.1 hypothetical protein HBH53_057690 [Parastagonospora nodorum]KAH3975606.1 hypothetical protein HBH52_129190 [Parastagonospora nodorum]